MNCPVCAATKQHRHYLCRRCRFLLPAPARAALNRRDSRATARLIDLHRQLHAHIPLPEIQVSP